MKIKKKIRKKIVHYWATYLEQSRHAHMFIRSANHMKVTLTLHLGKKKGRKLYNLIIEEYQKRTETY